MQIKKVTDKEFQKYGRVLDVKAPDLLKRLEGTPMPQDVVYVASAPELEACEEFDALENSIFGGMPIQVGYCNGNNHTLNAVEYHRNSEINIPLTGAVQSEGRGLPGCDYSSQGNEHRAACADRKICGRKADDCKKQVADCPRGIRPGRRRGLCGT